MTFLLVTAIIAAAGQPAEPPPPPVPTIELAGANNRFGMQLFSRLAEAQPQENVFISPLSIALALQVTMHGASAGTYDAMAASLGVSAYEKAGIAAGNRHLRDELAVADEKVKLAVANSLWLRKGVKLQQRFVDDCGKYYQAPVTTLNFASAEAAATINNWVSKHTSGKIEKMVSRLQPDDFLVIINAVYFKGSWTEEFDADLTAPRPFHLASGTSVERKMMRRDDEFRYKSDDLMQAVALPYGESRMNMYLFVPREKDGLGKLLERLTTDEPAVLFDGLVEKKGEVVLPRFKLEYEQSLTRTLKALGMEPAFSPQANFSNMVQPPVTAAISEVLHKTFVEVNEEGTEAAAATSVTMVMTAMPPREEKFSLVCDRPFLCFIRDDATGTVLFLGAIYNPKQ